MNTGARPCACRTSASDPDGPSVFGMKLGRHCVRVGRSETGGETVGPLAWPGRVARRRPDDSIIAAAADEDGNGVIPLLSGSGGRGVYRGRISRVRANRRTRCHRRRRPIRGNGVGPSSPLLRRRAGVIPRRHPLPGDDRRRRRGSVRFGDGCSARACLRSLPGPFVGPSGVDQEACRHHADQAGHRDAVLPSRETRAVPRRGTMEVRTPRARTAVGAPGVDRRLRCAAPWLFLPAILRRRGTRNQHFPDIPFVFLPGLPVSPVEVPESIRDALADDDRQHHTRRRGAWRGAVVGGSPWLPRLLVESQPDALFPIFDFTHSDDNLPSKVCPSQKHKQSGYAISRQNVSNTYSSKEEYSHSIENDFRCIHSGF